jgi:hypothetical protein
LVPTGLRRRAPVAPLLERPGTVKHYKSFGELAAGSAAWRPEVRDMSSYEIAQLNVGVIRGPMDSPVMAEFAANLDRINALADRSPGFVWRLQTEDGNATALRPFEDENLLLNMSVWRDLESLSEYVYRSAHAEILRRRREWFERMSKAYLVLWWVPVGHRPSIEEGVAKLEWLREHGPTPEAFTFRKAFPSPDAATAQPWSVGGECPAT